jgi:hypothetical protein
MVRDYQKTTGFPWTYAMGNPKSIQSLNVISTDIKYVVDRNGVITYQGGYGVEDAKTWTKLLQGLVTT